ncbi:hypothetical protein DL771_012422 [Monosporascus sp. 5C6A]|nr:hypothetical protein DL771_012422 [Monosporascus sp. 5C6A]
MYRNPFAALNSALKIATEPFVSLDANEMPEATTVASSIPASAAKGAKGKAKADAAGKADEGKWSPEETTKLVFLVMQHENPELAVQGWKDIGEKVQKVFDGKYSAEAAKKRFHNVRRAYLEEFPLPEKQDGPPTDTQAAPKGRAKAAAPKSRKRSAAVASGVQDSNNADDEAAGEGRAPKRVKTETQPAVTPTREEAQKGNAIEGDATAVTIQQEKQEKPAAAKPKPKRKVPAKKAKVEKQAADADADAGDSEADAGVKPRPKGKRAPAKPRAKKAAQKAEESTSDPKPEEVKPEEDKPSSVGEADGANGPAQDGEAEIQGGEEDKGGQDK